MGLYSEFLSKVRVAILEFSGLSFVLEDNKLSIEGWESEEDESLSRISLGAVAQFMNFDWGYGGLIVSKSIGMFTFILAAACLVLPLTFVHIVSLFIIYQYFRGK